MATGDIARIYQAGFIDGPGNRLVIYLQGCNFRCWNCHNPHTIGTCISCGECVAVCPHGALSLVGEERLYDERLCEGCDRCLAACPVGANPQARGYTVSEMVALIERYQAFITGITFSGGEPTLQWRFVREVAEKVRTRGLTVFLDSNGDAAKKVWDELTPVIDGVMLDIKAMGPLHRHLTGRDDRLVLASGRLLAKTGRLHHVRHLVIPGVTDREEDFIPLAQFVAELGLLGEPSELGTIPLVLLPFRPHGVRGEFARKQLADSRTLDRFAALARECGVQQVIVRPLDAFQDAKGS